MRDLGLRGTPHRRLPKGARVGKATSLDLVRRVFRREGPNQLWMADITEHPTREGKLYCAVVLDAFSRMIIGWAIDTTQTTRLVTDALSMAVRRRGPHDGLVLHSDRGGAIHILGVQPEDPRRRHRTIDGCRRQPIRQRHGRSVLGKDAGRTLEPQALEDPRRARHRDQRLHRPVPQHPTTPQRPRHAHPHRIRTPPHHHERRLTPEPRLHRSGVRSNCLRKPGRFRRPRNHRLHHQARQRRQNQARSTPSPQTTRHPTRLPHPRHDQPRPLTTHRSITRPCARGIAFTPPAAHRRHGLRCRTSLLVSAGGLAGQWRRTCSQPITASRRSAMTVSRPAPQATTSRTPSRLRIMSLPGPAT